ncbi:ribonuclease R [Tropicimonas sediminicola]|uniref:Ribonuclease R n=1 Tax=Tropicimonas sediminicola TaxID=1031541 RepID=A0A239IL04_9RHOB|nr:ribonuclease R [Tropicimonas sediminicola]SNS94219.1 RNAse R [Tropicimonas sediminicola]
MAELPTKAQVLDWIAQNPTQNSKRDIAKAFGVKGAARIDLKRMLKELEEEGHLQKARKHYRDPDKLPPVTVLQVLAPDANGDLFAKPLEWHGEGPEPRVLFIPREADPALGEGDRILGRMTEVRADGHQYEARLIRRIGHNPHKILGIYRKRTEGGRITPIDKGADREWQVPAGATHGAKDGELVEAEQASPRGKLGLPTARIIERLGDPSAPRAVSLIAIHQHGIPDDFPDKVIEEADRMKPAGLSGREDLRDLPLITIDPSDARDHDDAVYAHADDDPKNPGGHVVWVAIADVAHYVRPGTALDAEARLRGNSTYFPDRVVPMLPDRLSGDLCSLHEGVPRACIAVRMRLNEQGQKIGHSFHRGLMRSIASLSYEEVQQALDGEPNDKCGPLLEDVLQPLHAAYLAAARARDLRQPLDLDLPERRIVLSDKGEVLSVNFRDRLVTHRLIEEFMVLANVAAGETLTHKRTPLVFRVHEEPNPEKLDALRETAQASGFTLAKGQVLHTSHLNKLLNDAAGTDLAEMINLSTLRSMTQAYYNPENFGHFGLALKTYAHFTSPIRRYSDLIVHRGLISGHGWGKDGLSPDDIDRLEATAEHISETERRSMAAERDTTDRYLASYLSERVGNEFPGRISGIARFGVFVKLDETAADGLIPIRSLGNEFFHYDREAQTLMGSDSGRVISLGQRVLVRLTEAVPVTGGLMLELLSLDGEQIAPSSAPRNRGKPTRRMPGKTKARERSFGDKSKRPPGGGRPTRSKRKVTRKRK